jgi:hypothetical protein
MCGGPVTTTCSVDVSDGADDVQICRTRSELTAREVMLHQVNKSGRVCL